MREKKRKVQKENQTTIPTLEGFNLRVLLAGSSTSETTSRVVGVCQADDREETPFILIFQLFETSIIISFNSFTGVITEKTSVCVCASERDGGGRVYNVYVPVYIK